MRIKATISYDGSKFLGFQKQKYTQNTIVTQIELALKSLNIDSKIVGSGRTDKGVHAIGQVIHFDIPIFWQKKGLCELKNRLNHKLKYIKFKKLTITNNSFHAQYDAKVRVYRYIFKSDTSPFEVDYISKINIENFELFKSALKLFEGKHNFKYFKKEGSYTSSDIREIYKIKTIKIKNYTITYISANGFLRSQVRLLIASAVAVANGEISLNQLKEQIELEKRYITKPVSGSGLYLFKVKY